MNNNNDGTRVDLSTPQAMEHWLRVFGCEEDVLIEACGIVTSSSVEAVSSAIAWVTKQRTEQRAQKVPKRRREDDGLSP
ncbi:hypothetical protein SB18R_23665 [Pseudomonas oryzihabitans]|nr:hypothetical protein NS201_07905 [Pseudomonas psychrotolerans]KTT36902.1 hypothetical protein SB9_03970 [Pseudomonas psychrotolerans]KTT70031.1 hypothetical protein SB18R_23665 [Pseudomonas psychrotolerans]